MKTEFYNIYIPLQGKVLDIPVEEDYSGKNIKVKILDKFHSSVFEGAGAYSDNALRYTFTGEENISTPGTYFIFFEIDGDLIPEADDKVYLMNVLNFGHDNYRELVSVFVGAEINAIAF